MEYSIQDLLNILPIATLIGWACLLLLVEVFLPKGNKNIIPFLSIVGLVLTIILTVKQSGTTVTAFKDMLILDAFSNYLTLLVLGTGLFSIGLAKDYLDRMGWYKAEYYILMLFSISGVMLMTAAADLIVVFLALELLSIPLYIMAAVAQPNPQSEEAGMKYFLLGAFAGGFILYGIALVYGATATTNLHHILVTVSSGIENPAFLVIGAALILIGFGFKVAAVPFHMWTPDVYEGAPTPVTAYMAVAAKIGGFAALLRIFIVAFPAAGGDLAPVIFGVVTATLLIGNLAALAQTNIKRLFAYSSISHAGFILMAFITYNLPEIYPEAVAASLFYLLTFAIASFGSWAIVISLEKAEGKGLALEDYKGLGKKYPVLGISMLVFMLSFAGIPPTLGFAGKVYIFRAVIMADQIGLAFIGVLASLISAYYYLRLVIFMFMHEGEPESTKSFWVNFTTVSSAVATVVLFLFASPLIKWATDAVLSIL